MRALPRGLFLFVAWAGAPACTLLVDTDISSDVGVFIPFDSGFPDAGRGDAGSIDGGDTGPAPQCVIDSDCESEFGNRFRCARGRCFSLDVPCRSTERVQQDVTSNTTWWADTCYQLGTTVYVRNNATLTIRPGTLITGVEEGAALVVTRDGRIRASGTRTDPIVFTSGNLPPTRRPGDWGGVALLGRAPTNDGENNLEGLPEDEKSLFGVNQNPDPQHDCGTLEFVRIEFAGFEVANNNELNGLTLGACGFNTKIEHVQVHYGSDDGIEIFGGTVGLQRVVISRAQDDSLDWDRGWTGFAQFVAILQDERRPTIDPDLYTGGDNGIEADSLSTTNPGDPRSRPLLYNFTMIGSQAATSRTRAITYRDGTSAVMRNFLIMNYAFGMWDVQDLTADCMRTPLGPTCSSTEAFSLDGLLLFNMGSDGDTFVLPEPLNGEGDNDGGFNEAAFITTASVTNPRFILMSSSSDGPRLQRPILDSFGPVLIPAMNSPADITSLSPPPFMDPPEQVDDLGRNYIGAFEPGTTNDWMAGWTSFPDN